MDQKLNHLCRAEIGGDEQRGVFVQTQKFNQTFKHIMLPIWICSYKYQNKIYQFAINGQTGKVNGKKPLSWYKIGFLIFLFVAFIVLIIYLRQTGVVNIQFDGRRRFSF